MKAARKPVTIIAEQRRVIKRLSASMQLMGMTCSEFRTRAANAERECAEWKQRFDALLARTPEVK